MLSKAWLDTADTTQAEWKADVQTRQTCKPTKQASTKETHHVGQNLAGLDAGAAHVEGQADVVLAAQGEFVVGQNTQGFSLRFAHEQPGRRQCGNKRACCAGRKAVPPATPAGGLHKSRCAAFRHPLELQCVQRSTSACFTRICMPAVSCMPTLTRRSSCPCTGGWAKKWMQ